MALRTKRRLVVVIPTLAVATVIGIIFGYVAGVAVALAVVTLSVLIRSPQAGLEIDRRIGRAWGREVMGSDADERPRR